MKFILHAQNVEILLTYFQIYSSRIPTNESLFTLLALPTLAQTVQDYITEEIQWQRWRFSHNLNPEWNSKSHYIIFTV